MEKSERIKENEGTPSLDVARIQVLARYNDELTQRLIEESSHPYADVLRRFMLSKLATLEAAVTQQANIFLSSRQKTEHEFFVLNGRIAELVGLIKEQVRRELRGV